MVLTFLLASLRSITLFLVWATVFSVQCAEDKIVTNGDVIFGGLFPMHEKGQNGLDCGRIKKEKGIQRMEAMLFAVDKINKDVSLFPGLRVGVHILDTCSHDTYALEQSMDFIKAQLNMIGHEDYQCNNGEMPVSRKLRPVAGVIGAASSPVSIMVANVLRLFKNRLQKIALRHAVRHVRNLPEQRRYRQLFIEFKLSRNLLSACQHERPTRPTRRCSLPLTRENTLRKIRTRVSGPSPYSPSHRGLCNDS